MVIELVSGQGSRRKRAVENTLNACVVGGMIDRNEVVPGNQTSATLMNLSKLVESHSGLYCTTTPSISSAPNAMYEFKVQATTDVDSGNFSSATSFSTKESGTTLCMLCL